MKEIFKQVIIYIWNCWRVDNLKLRHKMI